MMKIVTVDRVSKRYRLTRLGGKSLREHLVRSTRRFVRRGEARNEPEEDLLAVDDVSFVVEQGETVGIIGPNGSGKSTILKLLARITHPTCGKISVCGSVASLIELGAGFHPELSGRENIYLYGSIMGMSRADVRRNFDQIVDFSELHGFLDTPVKRYSSGMYVRLGFAVAAHINPRVLLVDEVLAVGDAAFKRKCLQRIEALRRDGITILFVSHDMFAVERLCSRVFFLHRGRIRAEGEPRQVIADYYSTVSSEQATLSNGQTIRQAGPNAAGRRPVAEIVDVRLLNDDGQEAETLSTGEPVIARIEYRANQRLEDPLFEVFLYSFDGQLVCHFTTALGGESLPPLLGSGALEIACDELGLMPGSYVVEAAIGRRGALAPEDRKDARWPLKVLPGKRVRGLFYSPHRWSLVSTDEPAPQKHATEMPSSP